MDSQRCPGHWLLRRFEQRLDLPAVIWRDRKFCYGELLQRTAAWQDAFAAAGIKPGDTVAISGDYSPASITCLLALAECKAIIVPLARESREQHAQFSAIAGVQYRVDLDERDAAAIQPTAARISHPLLQQLRAAGDAGLIVFTSGSTGRPKAILHALAPLLEKFRRPRGAYRSLNFLLFDHLGGLNTLFYSLANLGCTVVPASRTVPRICEAVQKHGVELLPVSPSFLNLVLLSRAWEKYDLSSLQRITYGTEVMPEHTLRLANAVFPNVTFQQTYGLSELGVLRSKSAANDSLFVKVGGEGFETSVRGGTLWIRAHSSMLGYLNAPSPFDADGWFNTGDAVIQHGDYYRILGRDSEIINVGGQKVYPAEVEKAIAQVPGVLDVVVKAEQNLLLGQIVTATVQTSLPLSGLEMKRRISQHCAGQLQAYMLPAKVSVVQESPVNYRFKKVRRQAEA